MFNRAAFAVRLFNWKEFLALSGVIVVTLTDVLLSQGFLVKYIFINCIWSELKLFLEFSRAWSRS